MSLPTYMNDLYMLGLNPNYPPEDPDHPQVKAFLEQRSGGAGAVRIKRGEEIFEGVDYPRDWPGFIGQEEAIERLMVAIASARARGVRLDHTLLESGLHGIGKTTLATLATYKLGAGFVQTSGPVDLTKAKRTLLAMRDRDVWFMDEVHTMVAGGKAKAEWLLPFMTEGRLYTESGAIECPDVTIIAATTDGGMLPQTIRSRFMIKPTLVPYTEAEATRIAANLALRMGVDAQDVAPVIARAASGNPRDMRSILTAIRDLQFAFPDRELEVDKALKWAGFTRDGLTQLALEMMLILSQQANYTASIDSISAMLNEPGPLRHHEQLLMQRGFITITGRGRQLTAGGFARVQALAAGER